MNTIEELIIERIKPTQDEYQYLEEIFTRIKNHLENYLRKHGVEVEVTLQGSVAHDTWLHGDRDIDVFILFPKNIEINELRDKYFKLVAKACSEIGLVEFRYAEHPYVRLKLDSVEADIVPAYKLNSPNEIRTAVDRTPFHTMYVNSKLTREMKNEVRLLKKFMKSIGVYGAEIKTKGFSGYVVELLIIHYGNFRKAVEEISKWRAPVYLNTLGSEEEFRKIIRKLRVKYRDSIIYIPDPVDPMRNTTANVSIRNFVKLVLASNCYLKNPDPLFFEEGVRRNINLDELNKLVRNRCILILYFNLYEKLAPDVLWGELWRTCDRVVKVILNHGFNVIDYNVWSDEKNRAIILLELDECVKNYLKLYKGPEYWSINRVLDYIIKHIEKKSIGPWIDNNGSLVALGTRKFTDIRELLINRAFEYLVAPHFRNNKPIVKIINHENISDFIGDDELFQQIQDFIVKRPVWMEKCIG
ncbi:MAG: CCA tRNA nucleotidyltransferase [Desulfurococcaceae archaeon]